MFILCRKIWTKVIIKAWILNRTATRKYGSMDILSLKNIPLICIWQLCMSTTRSWETKDRKAEIPKEWNKDYELENNRLLPTENEDDSSLLIDFLDSLPDLDHDIGLFNYRVSSAKIKLVTFVFVIIFCGAIPATHFTEERPQATGNIT